MLGVTAIGELALSSEREPVFKVDITSGLELEMQPPIIDMLTDPNLDIVFAVEIFPGLAADRIGIA